MANMQIDNVSIFYEFYPSDNSESKHTLILVHGYLSSTFSFRYLIPRLKKSFSVAVLDLPGFGKSEKAKRFHYSMKNYGRLILRFIDQLGIHKGVLVGHSMGGQVILQAAKQRPDMVERVILLSASGYLKPFNRWLIRASYLPFFTWIVKRGFEKRKAEDILHQVVHDPKLINQEMVDGYIEPMLERHFYHSLIRLLRHHGGDLTSEELKTIQTPAQLIWGKQDRIVPLEIGKRLLQDLPHADLKVYEETGHLLPEEKPDAVYEDILAFLSSET